MSIGSGTTSIVFKVDGPWILLERLGFIVVGEHKNYTAQVFQLDLRPEEQTLFYNDVSTGTEWMNETFLYKLIGMCPLWHGLLLLVNSTKFT